MTYSKTILTTAFALAIAATSLTSVHAAEATSLSASDISFLWPLPETQGDVDGLISADETKITGAGELLPKQIFRQLLLAAADPRQRIEATSGQEFGISMIPEIESLGNWKVAGIRVDPSAPGCSDRLIGLAGSSPQIRLVLQPVTVDGDVRVHDFALHLVFDFVKRGFGRGDRGQLIPAIPDEAAFKRIVEDLVELKADLAKAGVKPGKTLGVHPGFAKSNANLTQRLRGFLSRHIRPEHINNVAMMGVRRPEPWIFFIMRRVGPGPDFKVIGQAPVGGATAQMFFELDPEKVVPAPANRTFGNFGVSTQPLLAEFSPDLGASATAQPVPSRGRAPRLGEIPDIIANPSLTSVLNTSCVDCHTESSMRVEHGLDDVGGPFAFPRPAGFQDVALDTVQDQRWNVRNFGWGVVFNDAKATVATRTANEAAESAEFINKKYLGHKASPPGPVSPTPPVIEPPAPPEPKANALTLVMTAKNRKELAELKKEVTALQNLPHDQNPVVRALDNIGLVHYARFVFVDDKLLVITVFDGDFDNYIDLFVDEIGDVFNAILSHVEGWDKGRVQDNRQEFMKFVDDHNEPVVGEFYRAYPNLSVQQIKAMERQERRPVEP